MYTKDQKNFLTISKKLLQWCSRHCLWGFVLGFCRKCIFPYFGLLFLQIILEQTKPLKRGKSFAMTFAMTLTMTLAMTQL